tara:strand:- start:404 stop:1225 length:822 start_codon:yes stop_codon:yes gene_type:complete
MINIKDKYIILNAPKCGTENLNAILKDESADGDVVEEYWPDQHTLWNINYSLHPHHTLSHALDNIPNDHNINDYKISLLVRNPYDRIVSFFHYDLCNKIISEKIDKDTEISIPRAFRAWLDTMSVNDFIRGKMLYDTEMRLTAHKIGKEHETLGDSLSYIGWSRYWPMHKYIDVTIDNDIKIYKYENYVDEINKALIYSTGDNEYNITLESVQLVDKFLCENYLDFCYDCNQGRVFDNWVDYYDGMDDYLIKRIQDYYKEDFERFGYDKNITS